MSCLCSLQLALHRTQRLPCGEDLVSFSMRRVVYTIDADSWHIPLLSVVLTSCLEFIWESWEVQVAVSDLSGDVGRDAIRVLLSHAV